MKLSKKRLAIALVTVTLCGLAAWAALDPDVREHAHDAYHGTLVFLKLASPDTEGAAFWCPMHPEIRRQAPGTCPI